MTSKKRWYSTHFTQHNMWSNNVSEEELIFVRLNLQSDTSHSCLPAHCQQCSWNTVVVEGATSALLIFGCSKEAKS